MKRTMKTMEKMMTTRSAKRSRRNSKTSRTTLMKKRMFMGATRFKKVKMKRMKEMMRSLEPMRKSILSKLGSSETGLLRERQLLTEDSLKDRRGL